MSAEEKKYRKISAMVTAAVQVVLAVVVYFLIAWREPDPPIPEYGIELSFGLEEVGREEIATEEPADEEQEPNEDISEETPQEIQEVEDVPEEESVSEAESTQQQTPEDQIQTEDITSPDLVEEEKTKKTPEVIEETEKKEVDPEPKTGTEGEENKEAAPKKDTSSKDQGNKEEEGKQGDPESSIDERALYGEKKGSQEGASLQMTGWQWDFRPDPQDTTEETGKIVFEIKIDDQGYIVSIKTLTSTVTPRVENIYFKSVEQLSFSKTSEYQPAPFSTGTITFIITSK